MSTKIYDVHIIDKSMYEVFVLLAEFRKNHEKVPYSERIDMTWRNNNDVLKIEAVIIPLSNRRTIVKPYYGGYGELEESSVAKDLQQLLSTDFKDFHYQNSTDRPDDVSAREWNTRELTWDRLGSERGGRFSDMGVTYELWTPEELYIRKRNR